MEQIKRAIPNLITMGNLVCGLLGLMAILNPTFFSGDFDSYESAMQYRIRFACYMVFAAAVFDVFDGMVARLLRVSSEIGKQLDSLCDAVSFGVLPAFIIMKLYHQAAITGMDPFFLNIVTFSAFLLVIGGVYRLARFNIDPEQSVDFKGMPIPAQAIATACLVLYLLPRAFVRPFDTGVESQPPNIVAVAFFHTLIFSFLMVSKLPLKSLKLKKGGIKAYTFHIVLIGAGILLFVTLGYFGLYLSIIFYVVWSLLYNFTPLKKLG